MPGISSMDYSVKQWSWIFLILTMSCTSPNKETPERKVTNEKESIAEDAKTILFFGNSITAGYQLDLSEAFPALMQDRLDSLGYAYRTVNAGLSGETHSQWRYTGGLGVEKPRRHFLCWS